MLYFLSSLLYAGEPDLRPNETIVVEAHYDREVYIAPVKVVNNSKDIEGFINGYSAFVYASSHSHNAQIYNGKGGYEPLGLNNDNFKVYNEETIKYVWEDCDYDKNAKMCAYKNNHYLLETNIVINNSQLVVQMVLFDPELQIISQGTVSKNSITIWIEQKEKTVINQQSMFGSSTVTHTPKEELPLRWEIPHELLDKHIHQASLLLWCSTKIKEE